MGFFKTFLDTIKNLDKKILKIMTYGLKFSFCIALVSVIILILYIFLFNYPIIFYIGTLLFRESIFIAIIFFICGITIDKIKKDIT